MRSLLIIIALASLSSEVGFAQDRFVCPPCGSACDTLTFTVAGACPTCGMSLVNQASIRNVVILAFDGIQTLDFAGPHDTFGSAHGLFRVHTVCKDKSAVQSSSGLRIQPTTTFADCPPPDILVIPGGGVGGVLADSASLAFVKRMSESAEITMSVCSGAFVLARLGLLDGLSATCHHGDLEQLRREAPRARIVDDRRWVDNGRIITAAGVTSGIDASLHVIGRLHGAEHARDVADYLEFMPRAE